MHKLLKILKPGRIALMSLFDLLYIVLSSAIFLNLYGKIVERIGRISDLTTSAVGKIDLEEPGALFEASQSRDEAALLAGEVFWIVVGLLISMYVLYVFFMGLNISIARKNFRFWWVYALQRLVLFIIGVALTVAFLKFSWFNKITLLSFFDQLTLLAVYILTIAFLMYIAYVWTARLYSIKKKNIWNEHLKVPFRRIRYYGKHYLLSLGAFLLISLIFVFLSNWSFKISLAYLIVILIPSISVLRIHAATL